MIKINLLGETAPGAGYGRIWLAGYLASLAVLAVAVAVVRHNVGSEAADLRLRAADLQARLDLLKEKTKEVNELNQKRGLLNSKLAIVARLKRSKLGPVRLLDDLNIAVPEGLWLLQIRERDGVMRIEGRALGDQEIVRFLENLKQSEYFESVDLRQSVQMYYLKRSGQVRAEPDLLRTGRGLQRVESSGRVTKAGGSPPAGGGSRPKWSVVGGGSAGGKVRDAGIDEYNIKIKEFVIEGRVNYAGRVKLAGPVEGAAESGAAR